MQICIGSFYRKSIGCVGSFAVTNKRVEGEGDLERKHRRRMMIVDGTGCASHVSTFLFKRLTLCRTLFKFILQLFVFISLYSCGNTFGMSTLHGDGQKMVQ